MVCLYYEASSNPFPSDRSPIVLTIVSLNQSAVCHPFVNSCGISFPRLCPSGLHGPSEDIGHEVAPRGGNVTRSDLPKVPLGSPPAGQSGGGLKAGLGV